MNRHYLGSKENPCTNIYDIRIAMLGRRNEDIYVRLKYDIYFPIELIHELNARNIALRDVREK